VLDCVIEDGEEREGAGDAAAVLVGVYPFVFLWVVQSVCLHVLLG
jgi:hypothetical protein